LGRAMARLSPYRAARSASDSFPWEGAPPLRPRALASATADSGWLMAWTLLDMGGWGAWDGWLRGRCRARPWPSPYPEVGRRSPLCGSGGVAGILTFTSLKFRVGTSVTRRWPGGAGKQHRPVGGIFT